MLSFGVSIQGFGAAALVLVPFDLGPNYSGPLNAVVHTFYAIAALLAPIIVGHFTPNVNFSHLKHTHLKFISKFNYTFFHTHKIELLIGMAFGLVVYMCCMDTINGNVSRLGLGQNSTVEYSEKNRSKFIIL